MHIYLVYYLFFCSLLVTSALGQSCVDSRQNISVLADTLIIRQTAIFHGCGSHHISGLAYNITSNAVEIDVYYASNTIPFTGFDIFYEKDTFIIDSLLPGAYQLVVNAHTHPHPTDSFYNAALGRWEKGDTTLGDSDTSTFQILSHPEFTRAGRCAVFPNPAVDNLFITGKEPGQRLLLQILQADGRLVEEIALEPGQEQIPLAGLPAGIYLLKIREEVSNGPAEILRFFKER